jgi:peptidoglycan/LPS O-acetylase OafA/YrhL
MLEIVRFLLAVVVVEAHIWPLNVPWFAWEAVFAFYTLSGFLMTMTLHKKYGFTGPGLSAFCINRILRLWPAYLVILIITVAALYVAPLGEIYGLLRAPQTSGEWAANLALVGLVGSDFGHMVSMPLTLPNNWSLSVEVFCYALLTYFGKTPRRLLVLAALGAVGLTYSTITCGQDTFYGEYCFQNRYGVLQAGFIPFAIGGLVYFYQPAMRKLLSKYQTPALASFGLAFILSCVSAGPYTIAPFIGSIGMAVLLAADFEPYKSSRVVDFVGRSSYHLFLSHWILAALLIKLSPLQQSTFPLFVATLIAGLLLSGVLVPMEHWIDRRVRQMIRPSGDPSFIDQNACVPVDPNGHRPHAHLSRPRPKAAGCGEV